MPKSSNRSSKRKSPSKRPTKNPRGGLTAAGREQFRRTEGAHLKPGVKKKQSEMTPSEMRRKGSWAVRFYGRNKLPALTTAEGKPTRFALTAAAWGEMVPKTIAAARRIAAKGERLLAAYRRKTEKTGRAGGKKASGRGTKATGRATKASGGRKNASSRRKGTKRARRTE